MKKGFTLVELLAVIVIISLLSVLTIVGVTNIVKSGKEDLNLEQKNLILKSAQLWGSNNIDKLPDNNQCVYFTIDYLMDNGYMEEDLYDISTNELLDPTDIKVRVNSTLNSSGRLTYSYIADPDSVSGCTELYEAGAFSGTITLEPEDSFNTYLGVAYLDPTNLSTVCNSGIAAENLNEDDTPTGINSGCMKFYIYADDHNSYKMILDHNISTGVEWANETDYLEAGGTQTDWDNDLNNKMGPVTANKQLQIDTAGWVGSPRLITANEIAHIVGIDEALDWDIYDVGNNYWFYFDGSGNTFAGWENSENDQNPIATSSNRSRYAWLYDYTSECDYYGCNYEDYPGGWGYWVFDPIISSGYEDYGCMVSEGYLYSSPVYYDDYGIRPVITLPKRIFRRSLTNIPVPDSSNSCRTSLGYNGNTQSLVYQNSRVVYTNATGLEVGDYTVTANLAQGNTDTWEDGTTSTKTFTCSIVPKFITPTITCSDKIYDGTTSASCTFTTSEFVSGDDVSMTSTCTSSSANVGSAYISCTAVTFVGSDAGNYTASAANTFISNSKINNATLTFNANNGTISGSSTLYARKGQTGVYTGIRNSTAGTIPTASREGYIYDGWAINNTKVIDKDGNILPSVSGITDSNSNWLITTNQTLTAIWLEYNMTYVAPTITDTHKGIIYMDPTDLTRSCNASNSTSTTGTKTGCMKFYVFDDTVLEYKLILDHNTSGDVAWNSSGSNSSMNEVQTRLTEDTTGWFGSPRLITADEVARVTGTDRSDTIKWDSSKDYSTSGSNIETKASWFYFDQSGSNYDLWHTKITDEEFLSRYAWLFEYTRNCDDYGCTTRDNNKYPYPTMSSSTTEYVHGYWTSTPVDGRADEAWYIARSARLYVEDVDTNDHNGVRPVITIPKYIVNTQTAESFGGTYIAASDTDTHKGIVYLNPTNLTQTCNATLASQNVNSETVSTPTGIKTGCMKFYVYNDEGNSIKLILDHNTSGDVAWNSDRTNTDMDEVKTRFVSDTTNWKGTPRLITADEIAHITGTDLTDTLKWKASKNYTTTVSSLDTEMSWYYLDGIGNTYSSTNGYQKPQSDSQGLNKYAWLFDYTQDCTLFGCNVQDNNKYSYPLTTSTTKMEVKGYWTMSSTTNTTTDAWRVGSCGNVLSMNTYVTDIAGVRPVIILPKKSMPTPTEPTPAFGGTYVPASATDTHYGTIYLNPQDLTQTCNATLASQNVNSNNTPTGIKTGCMKFYIYDEGFLGYKLILDHNTSGDVAWDSNGGNSPNEVASRLSTDTQGWYGAPRLITANEIAHIIGTDRSDAVEWDSSKTINTQINWFYFDGMGNTYTTWREKFTSSNTKSNYAWLFDYTYNCLASGCNVQDNNLYSSTNVSGYWTSDPVVGDNTRAWRTYLEGNLIPCHKHNTTDSGVRPVITIPKFIVPTPTSKTTYSPGDLVQYDPVNNVSCTSGATCYKWRVITVGDTASNSTITLQMDHNLVNLSAWITQAEYGNGMVSNTLGPRTALKALETATASWNDSLKLNYTYDTRSGASNHYGVLSCANGVCTADGLGITTNLKARMITGEEIRDLTVAAGAQEGTVAYDWTLYSSINDRYYFSNTNYILGTTTAGAGDTSLSWLIENTKADASTGATDNAYGDNNYGYWTLSNVRSVLNYSWTVGYDGYWIGDDITFEEFYGIRPVITISKSIFNNTLAGTYVAASNGDTHKGIVYLNPENSYAKCNATLASQNVSSNGSPTGVNSGCMKFYIYDDSGNNVRLILDHNTSGNIPWNSNNTTTMNEVQARLTTDTSGWYGNPRIISSNEIAHITGANTAVGYNSSDTSSKWFYFDGNGNTYTTWQTQVATATGLSNYAWLFDYTIRCNQYGCNYEDNNTYPYPTMSSSNKNGIYGYWTSNVLASDNTRAWNVFRAGYLGGSDLTNEQGYGVRPVITIPKKSLPTPVSYTTYNLGQLVQYDPVNNTACTSGTTCYKWRSITAYDKSSNGIITLQMDHNIVNKSAWVTQSDYNNNTNWNNNIRITKGPITLLESLEDATDDWDDSLKLNYAYDSSSSSSNYGTLKCINGTCVISGNTVTTNLKARIITCEEIALITRATGAGSSTAAYGWNPGTGAQFYFSNTGFNLGTNTTGTGSTTLSWLIENTTTNSASGATNNTYDSNNEGYWSLTVTTAGGSRVACYANRNGYASNNYVDTSASYGIRPVISIPKTVFSN